MPAPIVLQDTSGLAQGIAGAGSAFAEALKYRGEKGREQQERTVLGGVLEDADFSTPQGQSDFMMKAIQKGMKPEQAVAIIKQMKPSELMSFIDKYSGAPGQPQFAPGGMENVGGVPVPANTPQNQNNPNVMEHGATPAFSHPATAGDAYSNIPEEALIRAQASNDPSVAKFATGVLEHRDNKHKLYTEDRKYHTDRSKKYMESIDELRPKARQKRAAIEGIKQAITNRDLSQFSRDWWANQLGKWGTGLVTPEGALLSTNVKEFMLGDLGRLSGRPNMFIEQRILSMTPQVGQTDEANLVMAASLEHQQELEEKKIELTDQMSEYFENQLGYVPGNISRLVDQSLQPFAEESQAKLAYKLREQQEKYDGYDKLWNKKVPADTPLTGQMASYLTKKLGSAEAAEKRARQLGYSIPTEEQYMRYIK